MNEFAIDEEGRPQRLFRLHRPSMVVGRADAVDLVLPDVSVSRRHAQIEETEDGWTIADLGSSNGTLVNGAEAEKHLLRLGDVVVIGKFTLTFREMLDGEDTAEELPAPGSWEPEEHTDVHGLPSAEELAALARAQAAGQTPAADPAAAKADPSVARLVTNDGDTWPIGADAFVLGRDVPLTGVLPFAVSAEIKWNGTAHVIRKTGFLAAVDVNGKTVKEAKLSPGDLIRMGSSRFRYEVG